MNEASIPSASLETGAANRVVQMGDEGRLSLFDRMEIWIVVVQGDSPRLTVKSMFHDVTIMGNGFQVCSYPGTHSLDLFVVQVTDLFDTVLILTMLLLFLFLLQKVVLQCLRLNVLIMGSWLYKRIVKSMLKAL